MLEGQVFAQRSLKTFFIAYKRVFRDRHRIEDFFFGGGGGIDHERIYLPEIILFPNFLLALRLSVINVFIANFSSTAFQSMIHLHFRSSNRCRFRNFWKAGNAKNPYRYLAACVCRSSCLRVQVFLKIYGRGVTP